MDPPPPAPPVDHLSSLPEHLQDEILTRLDLLDAVRISAISRTWRRRWETLPGLALSFPDSTPPSVFDRVLLCYAGPSVSLFATYVDSYEEDATASASHVDDWLILLSCRRIESISIIKYRGPSFTIHSSIFSCDRLVSLTLQRCRIPPLPQHSGFAVFPVLKELYLMYVIFALSDGKKCHQLQAMIRGSPMLGVLCLEEVYDTDCIIEAHNVHTLRLISHYIDWRFGELPRLRYACVDGQCYIRGGPADVLQFLAGISQVEELIFRLPRYDFQMDSISFTFSNLRSLELSTDFNNMHGISLIFCILRSSSNLEKLKIQVQWTNCMKMIADIDFLNTHWTDGSMCANLQVVEIISCKGWLPLAFIEIILSKATCLRTLTVDAWPVSQDMTLNCKRASPHAQVLFKDQLEKISFNRMKFAEKRLN